MRHDKSPLPVWAFMLALLLSLTSATLRKHRTVAYYRQTGLSGCWVGTLPSHCTTDFQPTPQCTSSFGTATRTYYKDAACSQPCYELTGK